MRRIFFYALGIFLFSLELQGSLTTLFNSLSPESVTQSLAFYELYPDTKEGKEALARANRLLTGTGKESVTLLSPYIHRFENVTLSSEAKELIQRLASSFPNRTLKGYQATSEKEVLALPPEEIDLGKALLFSQIGDQADAHEQVENYSAFLDLMALQILARLPKNATPEDKIRATNQLIFEEMRFRFPPHSVYAKDIDLYTFLPSVMDNHLGVCLGVTAMYLAISQRIDLPLESITPPGHIYVRYHEGDKIINIETTARGIHMPCEEYLSVNTRHLDVRTIKEVVGMTHVNQASLYLETERYEQAVRGYEKARLYMPDDLMVKELLGCAYLFIGKKEEGIALFNQVKNQIPDSQVAKHTMAEDYLNGKIDEEGLKAVFLLVDEKRDSIIAKQKRLEKTLEKYPDYREGLQHMAIAWLQLNRPKEAVNYLKRYHQIDASNPVVEYYLAVLHGERDDYAHCWEYLKNAERLTKARNFYPKALRELRKALIIRCPE